MKEEEKFLKEMEAKKAVFNMIKMTAYYYKIAAYYYKMAAYYHKMN
jgi:hypothetical protein